MVDKSGSEHKRRLTASFKEWTKADMSKSTKERAKSLFKVSQQDTINKGVDMSLMYPMQIGLRQFSHEDIEWFSQAIHCGDYSRCGLAESLCKRTNWRNKKGKLCVVQSSVDS